MNADSAPDESARRLFVAARDRSAGPAREARLREVCGEDEDLHQRVVAMLKAHEEETTELGPGVPESSRERDHEREREGECIGRYKLLQKIGEGGFGTVWMAEQVEPVSRRVALKIIKLGMDTREVIARFEAERQALAMMDHASIARVLDAGATDTGRPFFVMELVKGVPITQFCDESQLGTRERLALFADVCAAINHAHQKGVIHRDIKPSNVMVTLHGDKAVPKVIDFGVAKATQGKLTEKTLFTRYEQFIGTPVYMSPEQATLSGLDIDTRSDIYSLGILLYELLTGKPPFDAKSLAVAGYEEMRRIIREVEPPRPSTRVKEQTAAHQPGSAKSALRTPHSAIEPDLDWIVMKAIEKDRTRRYETANGLALDIQRYLSDEPVSAMPPSAGYRFRKFARRNKTALRVAAGIVAVLVVATFVSVWQAIRATEAGNLARERLEDVTIERDQKEQARKDAETISNFLGEVFRSPDPSRDGRTITVAETLDKAAKKLETDLASQPLHRVKMQSILGNTYHALGLVHEAIPLQEKTRDYFLAAFGMEHRDTLSAMHNLAMSWFDAGRHGEALTLGEEVLRLRRKLAGPEHPHTVSAMINLANSYSTGGRKDEALRLREEVVSLERKLNGAEHPNTLGAISNLAVSYFDAGRKAEAHKLLEDLLPLYRKAIGPEHPDMLAAMQNLAVSYFDAGRKDEAHKLLEELLPVYRRVIGPGHPNTLELMRNVATSYDDAGRKDELLVLREEILNLSRKVLGQEHLKTLEAIGNLAASLRDAGRTNEALELDEEALALSTRVNGPEHKETLGAMTDLAIYYGAAGRLEEAIKLQEQSLAIKRRVLAPHHPYLSVALRSMADLYDKAGRTDEALKIRSELEAFRQAK